MTRRAILRALRGMIPSSRQQVVAASTTAKEKDHYVVLGVHPTASEKEIRAAYHKLAKELHPDLVGKAYKKKFDRVQEAYEVLSSDESRSDFDLERHRSQ